MSMIYGPLQLVVMSFGHATFPLELRDQLQVVREQGLVRIFDAVFVSKDDQGDLLVLEGSDLVQEEVELYGVLAGALFCHGAAGTAGLEAGMEAGLAASDHGVFGLDDDDLLEIADRIPVGSSALFLLLEHVWALGIKDAAENSQGTVIANGWITPAALVSMGARAAGSSHTPL
jgi:uncharacterized membrane protein